MIYKWITSGTKYQQLHYFVATATRVGSHFMVITRNFTRNYCNVKFKIMRKYVVFLLMKKRQDSHTLTVKKFHDFLRSFQDRQNFFSRTFSEPENV